MNMEKKSKRYRFQLSRKHPNMKLFTCIMLMYISVFLIACDTETANNDNALSERSSASEFAVTDESNLGDIMQEQEWVYVPERIVIGDEKTNYENMQLVGDTACYISLQGETEDDIQSICRYLLTDKALISSAIDWPVDDKNREISAYTFNADYSVWLIVNVYSADYSQLKRFLCKFDSEGKGIISQEVTEQLGRGIDISGITTDKQGRIYVFTGKSTIELYGEDGIYHGFIACDFSENVRVKGSANGNDNKFYVCISDGDSAEHCMLMEVDFEKKQITEIIEDFPDVNGLCVDTAGRYDLLLYDEALVYGYNFSTQEKEELFAWMNSDINGYFVKSLTLLEDGRYYATVEDWGNDDRSIVLLTRTRIEEAPQRENMVLATINGGSELNAIAASFNRSNNHYRITVKNYDSLTSLYNAILAKETIDIIDLFGVNVEKLSRQDVFEDLMPYLEQSSIFDRSDFLDGILDVYTFDGILVGIPETFTLRTVVGDRTQLGNDDGLSLDRLITIAESNPAALPFDGITKEGMMQCIMMFSEDVFIDWEAGLCYFDSETFKAVLELVNRFPNELKDDQQEVSLPNKIRNGEILFAIADLDGLKSFQPYAGMFGENAACVGFPSIDGHGGTLLFADNAFGIAAGSENKSGAWEFIEGVLNREKKEYHEAYRRYFPTLKKILNEIIDTEMEKDSQRPSNKYTKRIYEDGWSFTFHAVTWDEINVILDLVKKATPSFYVEENEIIKIINEEAQAYYSGQKEVEDVVSIIQNRIKLYVNENG